MGESSRDANTASVALAPSHGGTEVSAMKKQISALHALPCATVYPHGR
jgi:hypothetical protein